MSFVDELASGARGVRLQLPQAWELLEEHPAMVQALDREAGLIWQAAAICSAQVTRTGSDVWIAMTAW